MRVLVAVWVCECDGVELGVAVSVLLAVRVFEIVWVGVGSGVICTPSQSMTQARPFW